MNWLVDCSVWLYRQTLNAYPQAFRRDFGQEMSQTFYDCCREAYRQKGVVGIVILWFSVPGDLIPNALAEHKLNQFRRKGKILMSDLNLSLIVPAYNEESTLDRVIREALNELPKRFARYEVIIVNDGSLDKTAEIADQLVEANPETVRVIHHKTNKGYKSALETGFHAAQGVCMMVINPENGFRPGFLNAAFCNPFSSRGG